MSDCSCVTCGNPSGDLFLCGSCWGQLERDLGDVAALADELEVTITRQAKTGHGIGVTSRSAEKPLLFHAAASQIKDDLRSVLVGWVRDLWETNGHGRLECDDGTVGLSRWLLRHPTWIRLHPAADELHDEITDAVRRCWQIIDRAPDMMLLGQCGAECNGIRCDDYVYGHKGKRVARCRTCGTSWDVEERQQWMREEVQDRLANSTQLSTLLAGMGIEVASSTIRNYARPRKSGDQFKPPLIEARGMDGRRPLYRVGDVLDLLAPSVVVAA